MDYKKNLKYFENKKALLYGSAVTLALGVVLWFSRWNPDYNEIIYYISIFFILTGGIVFAITSSSRSNDKKIDETIEESFKSFEEQTISRFDLHERQLPYIESVLIEGYKYYKGSYHLRDGSGKYRTDVYAKTRVYFTKTELCIGSYEISLIKDEQTDKSVSFPYESIIRAYVKDDAAEYKLKNKSVTMHYQTFHIEAVNGEFTAQAYISQDLDGMIGNITRMTANNVPKL